MASHASKIISPFRPLLTLPHLRGIYFQHLFLSVFRMLLSKAQMAFLLRISLDFNTDNWINPAPLTRYYIGYKYMPPLYTHREGTLSYSSLYPQKLPQSLAWDTFYIVEWNKRRYGQNPLSSLLQWTINQAVCSLRDCLYVLSPSNLWFKY